MLNKADKKIVQTKKTLQTTALATALVASASVMPNIASADLSASVAVSNMYLWRGQNLSNPGAAVSGSLDYSHESGLYAGIWTSSEGAAGSQEYDLYFGFAGESGDFGYDIGYIEYVYPSLPDEAIKFDNSELYLGFSFAGLSADLFINTGGDDFALTGIDSDFGDSIYYLLSYSFDKYSFGIGGWSLDDTLLFSTTNPDGLREYEHIDISYSATDEVSFTLSQIIDEDDAPSGDNDMLVAVSWSKSFDL